MPKQLYFLPPDCLTHAPLCREIGDIIVDTFRQAGWSVSTIPAFDAAMPGAHLLMIGVGDWGSQSQVGLLKEAGRLGIRRTLWQMETLPPTDLPDGWPTRILLRKSQHRTRGLARLVDRLSMQWLLRQCRDREWNTDRSFPWRRMALPIREGRKLIHFWKDGLLDQILVTQKTRQDFLAGNGIPSKFMPYGYHPSMGVPQAEVERDLDVVFIGSPTGQRTMRLARIQAALEVHGYDLTVVDRNCYGEDRNQLLNRAKIILYLRGCPWEMPRMRLLMAMGCKALVVAEAFPDSMPFVPGKHLVMAEPDSLDQALLVHLEDHAVRQRIVDDAHALLCNDLPLCDILNKALSETDEERIDE